MINSVISLGLVSLVVYIFLLVCFWYFLVGLVFGVGGVVCLFFVSVFICIYFYLFWFFCLFFFKQVYF